ncbi:hypothetical protein FRC17_008685 [Serendipita sp. 399]|nr:hypothetical protein FRC17_008685 [Serendipita sp. 399]
MALADPRTRKLGLGSLIAAHEKVVQLEKGGSKADLLHTRIESLRILCQLKQEQGPDVDFRVYAQEFHEATGHQFTKALSEPPASDSKPTLHASVLHERSMGFILLCRAQMRAKKYEMAIKTANQGLEITNMITKTLGYGMPIEICQLGIMISECYLRTEKYPESLEHARLALSLAERIPEDKNPIIDALGVESDNLIWINRAGLNFCDTVYDSKVNAPGEEFGLKAAREGEKRNKAKLNIQFELEFAERALKAVHKAGRHAEALEASRSLLERLVKHLPESGSRYLLVLDQIDDVCEYAAESLEKIKMHTLANELRDKADDFNEFVQLQEEKEDQPLSVFADRAEDLRDAFFAIYKQAQESQSGLLPSPGQDSSKSDASSGPSSMAKLWKDWKNS